MIRAIVTAPKGKMDSLIIKCIGESQDIEIVGAIGPKGRDYIGKDVGAIIGTDMMNAKVYDNIEDIIDDCDIVVDFSRVELSMEVLRVCVNHNKPLICGTTGFNEEQANEFETAMKKIPVMRAANTSFMVQVMSKLLKEAAEKLSHKCKIEIIEMHDENKIDAPSGTALEMAKAMEDATNGDLKEIEFHSVRAGDIPSSHTVIFGARGERMEITHHAYNWECYARGACEAIRFMKDKKPGRYLMEDVIK